MRRGPKEFEEMLACLEAEPFALQACFVTSLVERLQDQENALGPVQHWIENRGKVPLTDLLRREHSDEASQRISTANAFGSLRALSRIEFAKIFEAVSLVDAELRRDPSGVYAHSDFATRDQCRRAVERVALESGMAEAGCGPAGDGARGPSRFGRNHTRPLLSFGRWGHGTGSIGGSARSLFASG